MIAPVGNQEPERHTRSLAAKRSNVIFPWSPRLPALWRRGWLQGSFDSLLQPAFHSLEMVLWLTLNDLPMSLRASPASLLARASAI
jgi:hypothetical protein